MKGRLWLLPSAIIVCSDYAQDAAQDEILQKVSMAIRIRSLQQDIVSFTSVGGSLEVEYTYQADDP